MQPMQPSHFFSKDEIRDLIISIVVISLIFSFRTSPFGIDFKLLPYFIIIVIVAFFLHEIAHRTVARRFGCIAFYKMWPAGTFFGLFLMLIGIKFVAPGAVVIYPYQFGRWGYRTKRLTAPESGLISLSGPATNLFFAIIFSFFGGWFFQQLTFVNAWLAFFNLLPFPPLDGSKVLQWRIWIWGLLIAISGLMVALTLF